MKFLLRSLRPGLIALVTLLSAPLPTRAEISPQLAPAASNLISGRLYLNGFPKGKTRNDLRKDYLGVNATGERVSDGSFPLLQQAIASAVALRNGTNSLSPADDEVAQLVVWEALEALLQGQLVAGNANLLDGLRVAFPDVIGEGEKPGGENQLPVGCPGSAAGIGYRGANITELCYARLHFQRGITAALDFLESDRTGELRAVEPLNERFKQYTFFNTDLLPDSHYTNRQDSQTAGYLLGNVLDRYGKAVVGIGDRLWRAAYFDKQRAPGGNRAAERPQMLDDAMREMQKGVHAQYLAALPLAATLEEDEEGYGLCRVDQVRVTAATAGVFIDRIRHGEIPKLNSFSLNSSTKNITEEITSVDGLAGKAATAYSKAEQTLWKRKEAENAVIGDAQNLKATFTEQLRTATFLNPDDDSYAGLKTGPGRQQFQDDLYAKIDRMLKSGINSAELRDGSELGQTMLSMLRAFADLASARNRIDTIPQQIRIEEERNGAINGVILGTQDKIAAYQLAIGIANSVSITASASVTFGDGPKPKFTTGVSVTYNPGAIESAVFQNLIGRAQAIQQVEINNINAASAIRNLLLQQNQYILDIESAAAQAQLAVASVQGLLARIDRLVENHIYYQDSNLAKWYHDPALIFEQEQAEIDYENALREYVRELYVLSQMLAVRWSEPYENPYLRRDGVSETIGGGLYDDFTQPESIFNVYRAADADNFRLALHAWDRKLRDTREGGTAEFDATISLREDIVGFSDVVYNPQRNRFETSPNDAFTALNKKRFRAYLLAASLPSESPYSLRLEFPLTYGQVSRKSAVPGRRQPALIDAFRGDWNVRVKSLSAQVLGLGVTQSKRIRLELIQHGKIEIQRFHPFNPAVAPAFLSFNLPLYYDDPERASVNAFRFILAAGVNGDGELNPDIRDGQVEPTPFCDRYVLLVAGGINVGNIEDIQFQLKWRSSIPPPFTGL